MHLLSTCFLGFTILAAVFAAAPPNAPKNDIGSVQVHGDKVIIECGPKSHQCCWVARALLNNGGRDETYEYRIKNYPDSVTTGDYCCSPKMGVECSPDSQVVRKIKWVGRANMRHLPIAALSNLPDLEELDVSYPINWQTNGGGRFPPSLAELTKLKLAYINIHGIHINADVQLFRNQESKKFPKLLCHEEDCKGVKLANCQNDCCLALQALHFMRAKVPPEMKAPKEHWNAANLNPKVCCQKKYGITCDGSKVTEISWPKFQLQGTFPEYIGKSMPSLKKCNVSKNSLSGVFPRSLGTSKTISVIDLSHNKFTGDLPASYVRGKTVDVSWQRA